MKVTIKDFSVEMEVKNNGVEFAVHESDGTFLGDLIVTKGHIIWCKGKQHRDNGTKITWPKFIEMMEAK